MDMLERGVTRGAYFIFQIIRKSPWVTMLLTLAPRLLKSILCQSYLLYGNPMNTIVQMWSDMCGLLRQAWNTLYDVFISPIVTVGASAVGRVVGVISSSLSGGVISTAMTAVMNTLKNCMEAIGTSIVSPVITAVSGLESLNVKDVLNRSMYEVLDMFKGKHIPLHLIEMGVVSYSSVIQSPILPGLLASSIHPWMGNVLLLSQLSCNPEQFQIELDRVCGAGMCEMVHQKMQDSKADRTKCEDEVIRAVRKIQLSQWKRATGDKIGKVPTEDQLRKVLQRESCLKHSPEHYPESESWKLLRPHLKA